MAFYKHFSAAIATVLKYLMYIAGACLLFMMAATMVDVLVRTAGGSIIGVYEISEILMVPIVFFTLPYVELFGGHAEVDLFYNRFPRPLQIASSVVTNLLAGGYLWLMTRYSFERYGKMVASGEHSALLHIPYSLLYILICFGASLSLLAIVLRTVQLFLPQAGEPDAEKEVR